MSSTGVMEQGNRRMGGIICKDDCAAISTFAERWCAAPCICVQHSVWKSAANWCFALKKFSVYKLYVLNVDLAMSCDLQSFCPLNPCPPLTISWHFPDKRKIRSARLSHKWKVCSLGMCYMSHPVYIYSLWAKKHIGLYHLCGCCHNVHSIWVPSFCISVSPCQREWRALSVRGRSFGSAFPNL